MASGIDTDANYLSEAELLEQFAGLMKACFVYPDNNERVRRICDAFMTSLETIQSTGGDLTILIDEDSSVVADKAITAATPLMRWMSSVFVKTAIRGLTMARSVARPAVHEFAEQLRKNFLGSGGDYKDLWADEIDGIEPLELTFAGTHGGEQRRLDTSATRVRPDPREQVMGMLLQDEEIMRKLADFESVIANCMEKEEAAEFNILDPICKALPAEAVLNPRTACELVDEILNVCLERLPSMIAGAGENSRDILEVVVADVGRRFFKAQVRTVTFADAGDLREGRPGDDRFVDDLDSMLAEFAALPAAEGSDLDGADGDVAVRESIGIYAHHLVIAVSDAAVVQASRTLGMLLAKHPRHSDLLAPYIDLCLSVEGRSEKNRANWRVIDFVQKAGLEALLDGRSFLTPDVVVFAFPNQFVPFLDSTESGTREGAALITEVCTRIGPERLEMAAEYLIKSEHLITEERVRKVLESGSEAVLPLITAIVEVGEVWVRELVASVLRDRNPPPTESAALRGVRPANLLPQYLAALCVPDPDPQLRKWLQAESGRMLCEFLHGTAGREDLLHRRVVAVDLLRQLPCWENLDTLKVLSQEAGFFTLNHAKRDFRATAKSVYREMLNALSRR